MPHCKVCGNPVTRDEVECRMCGSALKPGRRSGQGGRGSLPPRLPSDSYPNHETVPPSTGTTPYHQHESEAKRGSHKKFMAIILVLLIAASFIAFGLLGSEGTNFPIIDNTPSGTFERVTSDEQTAQTIFGTIDPSTQFSDCGFRISIYFPSQIVQGITAWQDYPLTCDNYSLNVYFVDIGDNGRIDAGDYCIIHSYNVPSGLQCTIDILYQPTGGTICSAQFSYS